MSTEFNKINDEALEKVVGGTTRTVHNDALDYANVRDDAGLSAPVLQRVYNGTQLLLTGNDPIRKDGYVWYEVWLDPKHRGWIAGSLIGY